MASLTLLTAGCSKKNTPAVTTDDGPRHLPEQVIINEPQRILLKATAFKMSGPYADNVAITLNADGSLAYYPDPSDISEYSKPVALGNGWYLNRQGITPNSRFTKYTFEEYAALKAVPTQQELISSIIPGAEVTDWQTLPYPAGEAMQHLPEIKAMLK